jgi:glycosyltransferase involved in cell wall biosynthesis
MTHDVPPRADSLVSVVIPFFDAGGFLAEAIDSVLAQSYPRWEILLVDDGSCDEGSRIARDYAARIPERIRYLAHPRHQNLGVNASRNLGIRHARGTFVAALDADDVWTSRKLEEQMAIFRAGPEAAFVYGTRELWTSWSGEPSASPDVRIEHGIDADRVYPPPQLFVALYGERRAAAPGGSDLVFRCDVARRLGGYPDELRRVFEDQAFLVKLSLEEAGFVSSRCWTRYRQHPDSAMAKWAASPGDEWERFVEWIDAYVDTRSSLGSEARRAARRAIFGLRHPKVGRALRYLRSLPRPTT